MLDGPLVFVDVDTQRDFLDRGGSLFIAGSAAILPNLARLTAFAREHAIPVLATACAHTTDEVDPEPFPPHCLVGTPGRDRVEATARPGGIVVGPDDRYPLGEVVPHVTLEKRRYDVFSHPDADRIVALYGAARPTFVVYGVATDYCVKAAVLGLLARGHRVALVADAVRAVDPDAEPDVLTDLADRGATLTITGVVCGDSPGHPPRRMGTMHDKYKRRYQAPKGGGNDRLRGQIAAEAARRLFAAIGPREGESTLREATEAEYYTAKRKAAAVLGHRVRPGDLPSDSEVRVQVLALARSRSGEVPSEVPEPDDEGPPMRIAEHLDRFVIYKMRLEPLEAVKQGPIDHPEGDALYHSLQVFERARAERPYDEEFLLAALLHDVGKAIEPRDPVAAGVEALRGAVTERTAWLIAHQKDALAYRKRTLDPRTRQSLEASESFDDLMLLRDLDEAGRVPGAPVGTIDQALDYLRGLETEDDLPE